MNNSAPLTNSLFMIIRELPSYLSVAHSLRFKDYDHEKNIFKRIHQVISEYKYLWKEITNYIPSVKSFERNIQKLDVDFARMNEALKDGKKPICAYFVSVNDYNGAIIGDNVYYYHHYKIKRFQKHYNVAAKVIRSNEEMHEKLQQLKNQYPFREVKVIDIVCHANQREFDINLQERVGAVYTRSDVSKNEFNTLADDAVIILDACSVGVGEDSIAESIARNNPGKTVMAPGAPLFFSKPIFKKRKHEIYVDNVVHGYAVVNAYTSRKFRYSVT